MFRSYMFYEILNTSVLKESLLILPSIIYGAQTNGTQNERSGRTQRVSCRFLSFVSSQFAHRES